MLPKLNEVVRFICICASTFHKCHTGLFCNVKLFINCIACLPIICFLLAVTGTCKTFHCYVQWIHYLLKVKQLLHHVLYCPILQFTNARSTVERSCFFNRIKLNKCQIVYQFDAWKQTNIMHETEPFQYINLEK